ncbi:hypothetical protein M758_5G140900 [Ceratodon purpureus]|uniref:Uncharacterized protein n=1 Tax=Ceratodon purpureus TaxID=3225 RepID=A0A8T0I402_CERPU|nr:hypothetical protein KC19_5G147300 [Ceratodon purpureus]KAG0616772.1 hypothetical protein M758_5G140900 [Ceratodon purpureus]
MAFSRFRQFASMKMKEKASAFKATAKQFVPQKGFMNSYNEKYIKTGSIRPLNDVLIYVFILAYGVGWPTELRHMKHEQEMKKHGNKGH